MGNCQKRAEKSFDSLLASKMRLPGYLSTNIQHSMHFCKDKRLIIIEALFNEYHHFLTIDYNKRKLISVLKIKIFPWNVCSSSVYIPQTKQIIVGSSYKATLVFYDFMRRGDSVAKLSVSDNPFVYPMEFDRITDQEIAVVGNFQGIKIVDCIDKTVRVEHTDRFPALRSVKGCLNKYFVVSTADSKLFYILDSKTYELTKVLNAEYYRSDVFNYNHLGTGQNSLALGYYVTSFWASISDIFWLLLPTHFRIRLYSKQPDQAKSSFVEDDNLIECDSRPYALHFANKTQLLMLMWDKLVFLDLCSQRKEQFKVSGKLSYINVQNAPQNLVFWIEGAGNLKIMTLNRF